MTSSWQPLGSGAEGAHGLVHHVGLLGADDHVAKSRGVASAWAMPNGRRSGPGRIPIPTRPDGSSASIVSTRSLLLRTRSWSA